MRRVCNKAIVAVSLVAIWVLLIGPLGIAVGETIPVQPEVSYQTGPYAISSGAVYVRGGPGTGFFVLGTLITGEIVPIIGISPDSGWWYTTTRFGDGWVANVAVEAVNATNVPVYDPGPIGTVIPGLANVRAGAGANAVTWGKLSQGEQVLVIGRNDDGSWVEVRWAQGTGWVSTALLAITGTAAGIGGGDVIVPVTADAPFGVVLVAYLNVRTGPSINHAILGQVYGGQELPILGRSADSRWYQIQADFGAGWVFADYIITRNEYGGAPVTTDTAVAVAVAGPIGIVNTGALNIRSGPGPQYTAVGSLPGGAEGQIIGRNADWSWWLMETTLGTGWASTLYIIVRGDTSGVPFASPGDVVPAGQALAGGEAPQAVMGLPEAVINTGTLHIRSGPNLGFPSLGTVDMGTRLPIIGQSPDRGWWLVVSTFGDGWVSKAFVITHGDTSGVPVQ